MVVDGSGDITGRLVSWIVSVQTSQYFVGRQDYRQYIILYVYIFATNTSLAAAAISLILEPMANIC